MKCSPFFQDFNLFVRYLSHLYHFVNNIHDTPPSSYFLHNKYWMPFVLLNIHNKALDYKQFIFFWFHTNSENVSSVKTVTTSHFIVSCALLILIFSEINQQNMTLQNVQGPMLNVHTKLEIFLKRPKAACMELIVHSRKPIRSNSQRCCLNLSRLQAGGEYILCIYFLWNPETS